MELDLRRSASDNRLFQEAAERDRSELESAYLRTVDIEVASANRMLEQESHYQREVAQAGYDRQRGILMAEAQSALTDQAATSDQRLIALAEESQRQLDLLKRDAEEQRAHLTERMAAVQQEVFTLKGNLQQSINENSALNSQLRVGHEAWHSSQETAVALQNQLQEERQRTGLLSGELQAECQKAGQMESQICSLHQRCDSQTAELQSLRHQLSLLQAQGSSTLPERVSKILADKEEEVREGKQSVATLLQRQAETQRYVSELRSESHEFQMGAKEWQDRYKDLQNVHYHSG